MGWVQGSYSLFVPLPLPYENLAVSLHLGSGQQPSAGTWACTLQELCKITPAIYKLSCLLRFSRGMEPGEFVSIKGESLGWCTQYSLGGPTMADFTSQRSEPGRCSLHRVGCLKQFQLVTEGLEDLGRPTGLQYTLEG